MTSRLGPEEHLELLSQEVVAMTAALRRADPSAAVAACPGWTVQDLAGHLVGVHRWVLGALDSTSPPPFDEALPEGDPADVYAAAAAELVARLRDLPTDHVCWTFDKNDRTASFWRRRQLHEVSVHRWDLEPYAMTDEVGEDGVDEVVGFFLPRQVATGRMALPDGALELVSPGRSWQIGSGDPVVTVEGSPGELALRLWGRGEPLPGPWRDARLTP